MESGCIGGCTRRVTVYLAVPLQFYCSLLQTKNSTLLTLFFLVPSLNFFLILRRQLARSSGWCGKFPDWPWLGRLGQVPLSDILDAFFPFEFGIMIVFVDIDLVYLGTRITF